MARSSLWTPLILILTIQLILLVCLNLKTSAPINTELLSVRISSSDPALGGLRNSRGSLVNIQSVVQIGAPANNLNGEQRNDEKQAILNENVPQIDAPINGAEQRVPRDGAAANPAVERGRERKPSDKQNLLNKNVPQIDAPGGNINNGAEQRVSNGGATADSTVKESKREPSDKERGVGVGDGRKGDAAIRRGAVSVNRNELRKRSDDEQLVGEREKANARGDRKGQLQQRREVHQVSMLKEAQDNNNHKKEEAVKDRGEGQVVDKKVDHGHENVPNTGRRKVNQVTMLKSRDPGRPIIAGDQNNKKPVAHEEKKEHVVEKKDDQLHNAVKKSNPTISSKGNTVKVVENGTNKRPLIEKVSQLKIKKAGYGRLRDTSFMKARRFSQQEEENLKAGLKPPKLNYKQVDDLFKYSDKLNYFEEFCKEVAEPLVECGERKARELTEMEKAGQNIMFTLRTTLDYHDQRLPVLFETWLSTVDPRTVFLVTDGEDAELDDTTENIGEGILILSFSICCACSLSLKR